MSCEPEVGEKCRMDQNQNEPQKKFEGNSGIQEIRKSGNGDIRKLLVQDHLKNFFFKASSLQNSDPFSCSRTLNSLDKWYIPKAPKAAGHEHGFAPPPLSTRSNPQKTSPPLPDRTISPCRNISPFRTSGSTALAHRLLCLLD